MSTAMILHDAAGQPVSSNDLANVQPVAACDVDHEVGTLARDARPYIQTIQTIAIDESQTFHSGAPHNLHEFITNYCEDSGIRVSFSTGPTSHKVYATVQRVSS